VKNVDHDIAVIRDDPLARWKAIDGHGLYAMFFAETILQIADDRLQMRFGGARTNHEKIGERRDGAQIDRDDVFRLFVGGNGRAEPG